MMEVSEVFVTKGFFASFLLIDSLLALILIFHFSFTFLMSLCLLCLVSILWFLSMANSLLKALFMLHFLWLIFYNPGHNVLRLLDVLINLLFTTSETMRDD